jgi:L-2-hydroxyglutarate oxidase LhgO
VLLEKEDALAAGASSGNSGLGCTGYDAPVGSLERRLLRRSIQLHPNLYRSFGMSYDHVRKSGSLVVAWTPEQLAKLPAVLDENREAGDTEAVMLSPEELREMEPALSHAALGAVFCPREAVVEPWLVPMGYAESARLHGADIRTSTKAVGASFDGNIWEIRTAHSVDSSSGRSKQGELLTRYTPAPSSANAGDDECGTSTVHARMVINCAGLYGDYVQRYMHSNENEGSGGSATSSSSSSTTTTTTTTSSGTTTTTTNHDDKSADDISRDNSHDNSHDNSPPVFTIVPRKGQFVVFKMQGEEEDGGAAVGPEMIVEPVATQVKSNSLWCSQ